MAGQMSILNQAHFVHSFSGGLPGKGRAMFRQRGFAPHGRGLQPVAYIRATLRATATLVPSTCGSAVP